MKSVAIVLARSDSARLPGKHFLKIGRYSLLEFIWWRLKASHGIDSIVLATSCRSIDDGLVQLAQDIGYEIFRGDFADVLLRFTQAAEFHSADLAVKVNGDSPFISGPLIDEMVKQMQTQPVGFMTGKSKYTGYPIGFGAEVIRKAELDELNRKTPVSLRESVTGFIFEKNNNLSFKFFCPLEATTTGHGYIDLTVDTPSDLEYVNRVWSQIGAVDPGDVTLELLLTGVQSIGNMI